VPPARRRDAVSEPLAFVFDGHTLQGRASDTVATALYSTGLRAFSHSPKRRRPRGLLCLAGRCGNCLMTVDGRPNQRTCRVRLRAGLVVESSTRSPSARPGSSFTRVTRQAELAVVGGGPAGISAALAAGRAGLDVTLLEADRTLGGGLALDGAAATIPDGPEVARQLSRELAALPNVHVMLGTECFAYYGTGPVCAMQGDVLIEVGARAVVVATGAHELPLLFENNDFPGVFFSTASLRLLDHGIRAGARVVVATAVDFGLAVARALLEAGVHVEAVVDARREAEASGREVARLRATGAGPMFQARVVRAEGVSAVEGVTVAAGGRELQYRVDALVTCGGFRPASELLWQATSAGDFVLEMPPPPSVAARPGFVRTADGTPLFAAGNAAGIGDLHRARLEGTIAGIEAALALRGPAPPLQAQLDDQRGRLAALVGGYPR
jgi:NADPH-dependent 2,4-dienoyl-CoA reductase/sulfur reductase-like enzyme